MTIEKENIDRRNELHKSNAKDHIRMRPGSRLGPRLPDEKEDEGGGGFGSTFAQHPLFANQPEGAADPSLSGNTNQNEQALDEAEKRENELNLQMKNELRLGNKLSAAPKLTRN